MYTADDIPVPDNFNEEFTGKPGMHRRESESWGNITQEDVKEGRRHFYAYTSEIDHHIGKLLDTLEKTGQMENTAIFFTTEDKQNLLLHQTLSG